MIVKGLLDLIFNLFSFLTTGIDIPDMPDGVYSALNEFLEWISVGIAILSTYTHIGYLMILFGVAVAVEFGIITYKIVMWVLKKIPMLGIE